MLPAMRSAVVALLLVVAATAAGQERVFNVDAGEVRAGRVIDLPPAWQLRQARDAAGKPIVTDPLLWPDRVHPAWTGDGWFALPMEVPQALVGMPLALRFHASGRAVVHLDGDRIAVRGGLTDPLDADALIPIRFDRAGRHELLVHYTNPLTHQLLRAGRPAGFRAVLGRAEAVSRAAVVSMRRASFMVWFFTTVFLAFGLLHFCLWLFQRYAVGNLWFAGLCLANGSLVFFLFYKELTTNQRFMLVSEPVMNVSGLLFGLFAARFVYGVFPWRFARPVFRTMAAVAAVIAIWSVIHTWRALPYVFGFMLLSCIEVVRVVIAALWRGRSGARLIGFGVLALGLGFGIALLRNLGWIPAAWTPGGNLIPFASMVVLIGSMSLYLSREFARTDRELRRQLVEVARLSEEKLEQERRARKEETERKLLEAEYRRKSEELEEARALQMSMLPRELPVHERLEIATWISTASEVGGDYYDFASADGTLLLGIGDATGHGMRAGTMVTAAKALFGALNREDLLQQMEESNRALRRMNLRRLAMAFTLARFDRSAMRLSSAGMPPVYVRRAHGTVETFELPGTPLGSLARFPYRQVEVPLAAGDFVVFMSDGLPELMSESEEMVGYERLPGLLSASAATTAEELVTELAMFASDWRGSRLQDDDITFVVVRMKEHAQPH
jgi:serine phosphatase RsbU (regulator of sigma subunit)